MFGHLAGLPHEVVAVAHLDGEQRLLALSEYPGSADRAELPFRALIAEALRLDAKGMILAHNHPGGDPEPSEEDRQLTRRLATVLQPLGIRLHDHLILTREGCTSFRALGLL